MTQDELRAELVRMRAEAGLSQARLAEQIGITQPRVTQIEAGDFEQIMQLVRWSEACGFSVAFHPTADRLAALLARLGRILPLLTNDRLGVLETTVSDWESLVEARNRTAAAR